MAFKGTVIQIDQCGWYSIMLLWIAATTLCMIV